MAKELNRARPFGTIHQATNHDGRYFEQDGLYFDAKGKEWVPPKPEPEAKPKEK